MCSEWSEITAGVPQGSVLGPLLFIIYINDITKVVTCDIKIFADDTSLYITSNDPKAVAKTLNENLCNVKKWADQWLVTFNANKTKSMTISNRKKIHPPLAFNNQVIDNVLNHKHLGIILNDKLNWTEHIKQSLKNVSKSLDVLQKLKNRLDRRTLETIYFSFIRSKIEYGSIVWDNCS